MMTKLTAAVSGLALCSFLTACGQSDTVPSVTNPSPSTPRTTEPQSVNDTVIKAAFFVEANNTKVNEKNCRSLQGMLLAKPVQADTSDEMNRARTIIFNHCP